MFKLITNLRTYLFPTSALYKVIDKCQTRQMFNCNFLTESSSKIILKIGDHLPKLYPRLEWHDFLTHSVVAYFTQVR